MFEKGNQFWRVRSKHGSQEYSYQPEEIWEKACEYFEWNEANPLYEEKLVQYKGEVTFEKLPKMRAMTFEGLCMHLGITSRTWQKYRKLEAYADVCDHVDMVIRRQKFEGAAAELLNPIIIARDLRLKDSVENSNTNRTADDDPWLALQKAILEGKTQTAQDTIDTDDAAP